MARHRARTPKPDGAVVFSGLIGAGAGVSWTAQRGWRAAGIGAVVGAIGLASSERVARRRQRVGELPPLWQRIAVSAALMGPLGWVVGRATKAGPVSQYGEEVLGDLRELEALRFSYSGCGCQTGGVSRNVT